MNVSQEAAAGTASARERSLPRVPLPTLEASCERFLAWCAPLLTAEERAATEAEVTAFLRPGGTGRIPSGPAPSGKAGARGIEGNAPPPWPPARRAAPSPPSTRGGTRRTCPDEHLLCAPLPWQSRPPALAPPGHDPPTRESRQ